MKTVSEGSNKIGQKKIPRISVRNTKEEKYRNTKNINSINKPNTQVTEK